MNETPISVIDVSAAVDGTDPEAVAHRLGAAVRDVGFLQIIGHGIDPALFHRLHDAAVPLWAQSPAELDAHASPIGHPFRGVVYELNDAGEYRRQGLQNNRYLTAEEAIADGVPSEYADFFGGNAFPPMDDLRAVYLETFTATRTVGRMLTSLFAVELGLGPDGFADAFAHDASYLAVLNYPSNPSGHQGDIRNGEHTDSGALAMLHQRGDYEGLFVRLRSGERVTMPIIDEALVVNIGDLVARWTNDRWLATPHWVAGGAAGQARSTVVTHFMPGAEAVIAPLASCISDGGPQYEPVRMYDWNDLYFAKRSRVLRLATAAA